MTDIRSTPNLLGMRLAHRAMLADTARFAVLAGELAAIRTPCPPRRARAIAGYLDLLCDSIHHHHRVEDEVLWPTLTAAAGDAIELRELTDDHAQLDPALAEIRTLCADLVARRPGAAAALAERLTRLHTVLDEHIADEERTVFPVVTEYLTTAQWAEVEAAARKGAVMSFEVPRMAAVCTPAELAEVTGDGGWPLRVMLRVFGVRYRRRERVLAGE
ncbi:hemerythrin domain-containing protein [Nocardia sp. NPDC050718]|uniref:hemerythrin domain-containing protein n=1 Tax=Nocardia sp. NPDC050718 TaxID=3155788 RepID=UPI0033C504E4